MRKLLLLILVLLGLGYTSPSPAWNPLVVGGGGGVSCTSFHADGVTDDGGIHIKDDSTFRHFTGMRFNDSASSRNICQVDFYIEETDGDITGYTYHAEIWTIDGSDDLDTQQGSDSNGVAGQDGKVWYQFTFDSAITLSQSTDYAIVVTHSSAESAVNIGKVRYDNNTGGACTRGTYRATYDDTGTERANDTDDCIRTIIYAQ